MKAYDILSKAILQVSTRLNKKALKEALEDFGTYDLNTTLYHYYLKAHYQKAPVFYHIYTFDKNDPEDLEAFNETIKDLRMKKYKKEYDYKNDKAIKFKNTYAILEQSNGWNYFGSYVLDVYQFIEAHNIKEEE